MSQTANPVATIRRVAVLNRGTNFEIEIEASEPVTPQTQVVSGPDRLVVDFPHAVPGSSLRSMMVNAGEVKGIRTGLFASNPPVTRVVLDLKSPQRYQVFPSGRTVIVKLMSGVSQASLSTPAQPMMAANTPPPQPAAKPAPRLQVDFSNGKLRIWSNHASLAEVLREVQRTTGATVAIPAGADQQPVIADLGPAPAREVLTSLLHGSSYNVVLIGSGLDLSVVTGILLTPRGPEGVDMPANYAPNPAPSAAVAQPDQPPLPEIVPENAPPPPPDNPPPDNPPPPDTNTPPPQ